MGLRSALALSLLYMTGCGTGPEDFGRCSGGLALTVSSEESPLFSWIPADCPVYQIEVEQAGNFLWVVTSESGGNDIESPVRYPPASVPDPVSTRLTPGVTYTVRLWRIQGGQQFELAVEKQFIHQVE